jgi:hypothetical protein
MMTIDDIARALECAVARARVPAARPRRSATM